MAISAWVNAMDAHVNPRSVYHLIFGRHFGLVLATLVISVLLVIWVCSLHIACPYHDNRFCVRTELMGVTSAFPLMVSFLILSFPDSISAFSFLWSVGGCPELSTLSRAYTLYFFFVTPSLPTKRMSTLKMLILTIFSENRNAP